MKRSSLHRRDLSRTADLMKPVDQASSGLVGICAIEVSGAESAAGLAGASIRDAGAPALLPGT